MKKKFVFIFTIGGKIVLSGDDADAVVSRGDTPYDKGMLRDFVDHAEVGSYRVLQTGEIVFRNS